MVLKILWKTSGTSSIFNLQSSKKSCYFWSPPGLPQSQVSSEGSVICEQTTKTKGNLAAHGACPGVGPSVFRLQGSFRTIRDSNPGYLRTKEMPCTARRMMPSALVDATCLRSFTYVMRFTSEAGVPSALFRRGATPPPCKHSYFLRNL